MQLAIRLSCIYLASLALSSASFGCRIATGVDIGRARLLQPLVKASDTEYATIYVPRGDPNDAKLSAMFHKTNAEVKLTTVAAMKTDYLLKFMKADGHSIYYVTEAKDNSGCVLENQPNADTIQGGVWSEMRP